MSVDHPRAVSAFINGEFEFLANESGNDTDNTIDEGDDEPTTDTTSNVLDVSGVESTGEHNHISQHLVSDEPSLEHNDHLIKKVDSSEPINNHPVDNNYMTSCRQLDSTPLGKDITELTVPVAMGVETDHTDQDRVIQNEGDILQHAQGAEVSVLIETANGHSLHLTHCEGNGDSRSSVQIETDTEKSRPSIECEREDDNSGEVSLQQSISIQKDQNDDSREIGEESTNLRCHSLDSGLELNSTYSEDQGDPTKELKPEVSVCKRKPKELSALSTDVEDDDDQDEKGLVNVESFRTSKWIFTKDEEDTETADDNLDEAMEEAEETDSVEDAEHKDSESTTISEIGYRRSYKEISFKRIQRQKSRQTYARVNTSEVSAEKVVTLTKAETSEGLGFHILGDHPTLVSTVVPDGVAERQGVEVGDVILAINHESVLHMNHAEIVETLLNVEGEVTLDLCKESSCTLMAHGENSCTELFASYMYKLSSATFNYWKKRWFVLKSDNCLYYYKSRSDKDILGAIPLSGYVVMKAMDLKRPRDYALRLMHSTKTYHLAALDEHDFGKWANLLNEARSAQSTMDNWLDASAHNVGLPALSIRNPDCTGYLHKMGGHHKSWRRRYCVLKDGCLFYYCDIDSRAAQGVAHFHGYTSIANPSSNKRNAFELAPPEASMRRFYFYTDTELDKERWIRALKLSIGRWVQVK